MNQITNVSLEQQPNYNPLIYSCLKSIKQELPIVRRVLSENGSSTVDEYTKDLFSAPKESYQNIKDLEEVIVRYTSPLLGSSIAYKAAAAIGTNKVALTTNHHGVDYFAQSVQGSLLFSLASQCHSAIPVFACGNIPLNNLTYPRGALIYQELANKNNSIPIKMPLFPDRLKRTSVSRVPAFNEQMIKKMQKSLLQYEAKGGMNKHVVRILLNILEQDYNQERLLNLTCYSDQSVLLNQRIWERIFSSGVNAPPLIYLELEKIASLLLEYDLKNTESLAYLLLFNPAALSCLHFELRNINGSGTFLFWGLDSMGRTFQLIYNKQANQLYGRSIKGELLTVNIEPLDIAQKIQGGQLLPSLFTSFLVVSLARGITCAGGYYQAEYLPKMQQAVAKALCISTEWTEIVQKIKSVNTQSYLSGMQVIMSQFKESELLPAGPLEIIASGGLTASDIEQLRSVTVKSAHIASILETVADVIPSYFNKAEHFENMRILMKETSLLLEGSNVVVKKIY